MKRIFIVVGIIFLFSSSLLAETKIMEKKFLEKKLNINTNLVKLALTSGTTDLLTIEYDDTFSEVTLKKDSLVLRCKKSCEGNLKSTITVAVPKNIITNLKLNTSKADLNNFYNLDFLDSDTSRVIGQAKLVDGGTIKSSSSMLDIELLNEEYIANIKKDTSAIGSIGKNKGIGKTKINIILDSTWADIE